MPPWETVKSLLSFLVTDGVSDSEEQLEFGIFDISRGHLCRKLTENCTSGFRTMPLHQEKAMLLDD